MRLVDFEPRWVVDSGSSWQERHGMGVGFDCPHCRKERIVVWFSNPVDNLSPILGQRLWTRGGSTFETLSLLPSIIVEGHWHGLVTDGAIFTA